MTNSFFMIRLSCDTMKLIKINLNEEQKKITDDITIIPIADVHIGDTLSNLKLLKQTLERIKNEPNTYTIINGDLCNMALKNSKSDVYKDSLSPMTQVLRATDILEDIKDKILVISTGNHEDRTQKETDIDVMRLIARELKIEDRYANGWWYLYLTLGQDIKKRAITYGITGLHGYGGGRKSGAKINRLEDMSQVVLADLYIMSHTHKPISTKNCIYIPYYQSKALMKQEMYYLMTNSFLESDGGYAEKMGFPPSNTSITEAKLYSKKRKINITI